MKKLSLYIFLVLMICNVGFADVVKDALTNIKKTEDLLKGNYKCQSILTQGRWTFSFSKISGKNYYIKNVSDDNPPSKQFGVLKKYNILFWYYILPVEENSVLIANVLKLDPKIDENFMSIIIFFDGDFTKEDLRKLIDSSNESEQAFFNDADNFVETRINSGSQGNFQNFDKGICKTDYKPSKKLPKISDKQKKINLEKLKKYKPTELAPGVKKELKLRSLPECEGDDYKKWTNCFGTYTNEAGRKYTGEFGDAPGIRHGEGISILKGTKFEGIFENDKAVLGKLNYPSGDSFEGTYNEKGNFEGKGKFTFQDGGYVVGTWIDHKLQGKGTMVDSNGNERNVTYKDGKIVY